MIVRLGIENFKSFRGRTEIDFSAGTTSKLAGNLLRRPDGERFVKSMALYGANASGKTTVLDALYTLGIFVLFSSNDQNPSAEIPGFIPFALDRAASEQPARVTLTIDLDGAVYTLDVAATADRVWNEVLETRQSATQQSSRKMEVIKLIDRRWRPETGEYEIDLHPDVGTKLTRVAAREQTPQNRLILGKLAALNNKIAKAVLRWFDQDLGFYDMHRNPSAEEAALTRIARRMKKDLSFAKLIERFVRDADVGVQIMDIVDEKQVVPMYMESDQKFELKESVRPSLSFKHASRDGSNVFFRQHDESSGTLRFLALLATILQPSPRRRLICVDELSASMHPDLVRRLVQSVHSSAYNPSGNQLFFTTHDSHLINPDELLRRDQITLCSKDRFGRSVARRLDAYGDLARSDANLQKQYLQGRFGGIPQFGPTLADVPVDDEPLEVSP